MKRNPCTCAAPCPIHPGRRADFATMEKLLRDIRGDLEILSGNVMGDSGTTWHDVAGTLAVNLRCLASQVEQARKGNAEPFLAFPSFDDVAAE